MGIYGRTAADFGAPAWLSQLSPVSDPMGYLNSGPRNPWSNRYSDLTDLNEDDNINLLDFGRYVQNWNNNRQLSQGQGAGGFMSNPNTQGSRTGSVVPNILAGLGNP